MRRFGEECMRPFQMRLHHLTPETKGQGKENVIAILRDIGGLSWMGPIYRLMPIWKREWLSQLQWHEKKIVEGRFFGGSLQYVPREELAIYYQALTPRIERTINDRLVFDYIERHGPISKRGLAACVPLAKTALMEALHRLDLGSKVVFLAAARY